MSSVYEMKTKTKEYVLYECFDSENNNNLMVLSTFHCNLLLEI